MALPKKTTPAAAAPRAARKTAAPVRARTAAASAAPAVEEQQATVMVQKPGKDFKKEKRVRISFTLPESQYALLAELKARCLDVGINVRKSELLAAGLQMLKNLPKTALEASISPSLRSDRKPARIKKPK